MEPPSSQQPSQPSFKKIVVQDNRYKPNINDASTSSPSAPKTNHHNTEVLIVIPDLLNNNDIPVINEKDLTNISLFE